MDTHLLQILLGEGGFVGIATLVVKNWQVPALDPANPGVHLEGVRQQQKLLRIILWMGFSLVILTLGLAYWSASEEGGNQRADSAISNQEFFTSVDFSDGQGCRSVKVGQDTIWQSFTAKKYFLYLEARKDLKVVLNNIDASGAELEVQLGARTLARGKLTEGQSLKFTFEGCQFSLTYVTRYSFNAGFKYLFKERESAIYEVRREDAGNS
jgi:hypothetical protein